MKKMNLRNGFLVVLGISTCITTSAQLAGDVDESWGNSGWIIPDNAVGKGEVINELYRMTDDGFFTVGYTETPNMDFLITKHNSDGTLDTDFGADGVLTMDVSIGANDAAYSIQVLWDNKILVTGATTTATSVDLVLVRLLEDGSIDNSFGSSGIAQYSAGSGTYSIPNRVRVLQDNSILIGASLFNGVDWDMALLKFTQGGGQDMSFGTGAVSTIVAPLSDDEFHEMEILSDGNVVICGTMEDGVDVKSVMYKISPSTGDLDETFNTTGSVEYNAVPGGDNIFRDIKATSDGKIIVVGYQGSGENKDGIILKFNEDGTMDETFASVGIQILDIGSTNGIYLNKIEEIQDGLLLASGTAAGQTMYDLYAFMFNPNGSSECEFACAGVYIEPPFSVATMNATLQLIQSDGSILIGGNATSGDLPVGYNMFLTKIFNTNQIADLSELNNMEAQFVIYPNPAEDKLNLIMNNDEEVKQIQLIALDGRVAQDWNGTSMALNLNEHVAPGNYLLQVITSNGEFSKHVTIK